MCLWYCTPFTHSFLQAFTEHLSVRQKQALKYELVCKWFLKEVFLGETHYGSKESRRGTWKKPNGAYLQVRLLLSLTMWELWSVHFQFRARTLGFCTDGRFQTILTLHVSEISASSSSSLDLWRKLQVQLGKNKVCRSWRVDIQR